MLCTQRLLIIHRESMCVCVCVSPESLSDLFDEIVVVQIVQ